MKRKTFRPAPGIYLGRPLSEGPKGGNGADESKDGHGCPDTGDDGDDNVFGAGEGLTRSG